MWMQTLAKIHPHHNFYSMLCGVFVPCQSNRETLEAVQKCCNQTHYRWRDNAIRLVGLLYHLYAGGKPWNLCCGA